MTAILFVRCRKGAEVRTGSGLASFARRRKRKARGPFGVAQEKLARASPFLRQGKLKTGQYRGEEIEERFIPRNTRNEEEVFATLRMTHV